MEVLDTGNLDITSLPQKPKLKVSKRTYYPDSADPNILLAAGTTAPDNATMLRNGSVIPDGDSTIRAGSDLRNKRRR